MLLDERGAAASGGGAGSPASPGATTSPVRPSRRVASTEGTAGGKEDEREAAAALEGEGEEEGSPGDVPEVRAEEALVEGGAPNGGRAAQAGLTETPQYVLARWIAPSTADLASDETAAVIFGCKNTTMAECLRRQLFGCAAVRTRRQPRTTVTRNTAVAPPPPFPSGCRTATCTDSWSPRSSPCGRQSCSSTLQIAACTASLRRRRRRATTRSPTPGRPPRSRAVGPRPNLATARRKRAKCRPIRCRFECGWCTASPRWQRCANPALGAQRLPHSPRARRSAPMPSGQVWQRRHLSCGQQI